MFDTPVALIAFRRPQLTARVMERIAAVRPRKLLVIADGPCPSRPGEAGKCAAARARIDDAINWDCQVLKRYSDVNIGVEKWISGGLDWVFEQCEEAIILEDDDLPDPSFFPFCAQMLQRYREDARVMAVNGTSLQHGRSMTPHSYYFSRYFHCWGFATWRRAWRHYDVNIRAWPKLRRTRWLQGICENEAEARYFRDKFDRVAAGEIPTWDYQVSFAMWAGGGLAITPDVNLISNIGHGHGDGLYSNDPNNPFASLPLVEMPFPLRHPPAVERDAIADLQEFRNNIEPVLEPARRGMRHKLKRVASRTLPWRVKALLRPRKKQAQDHGKRR
jgi:hypothetical protein